MSTPEPYKIKTVESIYQSSISERQKWIKDASYNLFNLKSQQVFIDLLTDSGTGAMSDKQWSAMMSADESYAGSRSHTLLGKAVKDLFGFPYFLPTHQGRAAENVLFSALVSEGNLVPGNTHFDTTKGHIEFRKAKAIDCTIDEAFDTHHQHPFKGNIDLKKLETVLASNPKGEIPFIIVTITCNSAGGQPVSMENMRSVRKLADQYNIPILIDSARFAENAYYIKTREDGYREKDIREIIGEMYAMADMMTLSAKKDGLVNIGGLIACRDETVYRSASTFNIMFEGFISYGGLAGRDMSALAQGLYEVTEFPYLESRIKQVAYLGENLLKLGIPIQEPVGGHAVFLNALEFLPNVPREEFPAQTLAIELYMESGIRGVEIGTLMADRDPVSRENRYPALEMVRLALPRRTYTNNHMDFVIEAVKRVWTRRENISRGYRITREAPILRHFTIELEPVE